jgi:hypothetical protein
MDGISRAQGIMDSFMEKVLRRNCGDPGMLANGGLREAAGTASIDLRTMLLSTWIPSARFTDTDPSSHDSRRARGRPVARGMVGGPLAWNPGRA